MDINLWITFVAASAALLMIPGPTVLLVLSYAISQNRCVALASVVGVACGDFAAMTVSLAGLGALVLASALLFTVMKWIGAAYLIYLGVKLFRSADDETSESIGNVTATNAKTVFRNSATVTALNPKSNVFFIAFVPQFVSTNLPLVPQFAILIATFVGLAFAINLTYALLANQFRSKIERPSVKAMLSRLGGSALILMGTMTAVFRRATA